MLCINFEGISMDSLAAQAFLFFAAGFETSSTTMTFCLYELSLHQDIQDRLREEIDVVLRKHDGKLTYEGIQQMEYLDKVVSGKAHPFKYIYIFWKHDILPFIKLILQYFLSLLQSTSHSILGSMNNQNIPIFPKSFLLFTLLFS